MASENTNKRALLRSEATSSKKIISALKALSDETRIRILRILSLTPLNVQEITEVLDMGQSRVSRHLKILLDAGFLHSQREGSWVYYRLQKEKIPGDFPSALLLVLLAESQNLPFSHIDYDSTYGILKKRDLDRSAYFNTVAKDWESIQKNVLDPVHYRKKILQLLPESVCRIFDLGCGPGGLIPYLLTRSKEVTGIDSSESMIQEARSSFQNNPNVNFLVADLESLPVSLTSSAEAVVASMVLHHLSNPPKALREIKRVLVDEGTLVIVDLKKHSQEFMRDNFADLWLGFDLDLLTEWLEHSGFELISTEEIDTQEYFKVLIIKARKKGGL
ncbi:ArsR/SmtB family transcription factor [Leptospira perolatii]|uniref:ArsR/SmtB family transcription factor n=1 Tax=Leptospira perolatii TaxID=2023191 RepID=UPI001FAF607F|nr:metalloregulator ArsR/SmtB family transcription factor [Leptospira perolatii]